MLPVRRLVGDESTTAQTTSRSYSAVVGISRGSSSSGDEPECGDAEFGSCRRSLERGVDLGELVFDSCLADLEALDFAEPAFAFGFDDAGFKVVVDLLEPGPLGGVRSEERASDAGFLN